MGDRDDLIASWAETERDLRGAVAQVEIGPDASSSVSEYLDHNELGLAFATLVESLDQLGANPPAAAMEHLRAANERMDSPPDGHDAWERLRALDSAIGLPSKSTSASWMLVFLMPLEVRRSFMVPPGAITAGETSLGASRIRTRWRLADHRKLIGSGQIQPHGPGDIPEL